MRSLLHIQLRNPISSRVLLNHLLKFKVILGMLLDYLDILITLLDSTKFHKIL